MYYNQHVSYKVTKLEVDGSAMFSSRREFELLRQIIEEESSGKCSLAVCIDNPSFCETYIVE